MNQDAAPLAADPKQAKVTAEWKHSSPLIACRFDPTGKFVFTGSQDNLVHRWERATGKSTPLAGHDSWVRAIGFLPDGQTVLTGGYDGRLCWWSAASEKPEPSRKLDAHTGWLRTLAVSPDGALVATGGNDNLVKLWNAADGSLVRTFTGHAIHVYSTLFHPSGQFLLSGDLRGVVNQWETATGKLVRTFDAKELYEPNPGQGAEYGGVRTMALSPDGKHLVCGGLYKASNPFGAVQDPLVLAFSWETGQKTQSLVAAGDLKGIIWRAAFLKDGTLLGASGGSGGGQLLFWQIDKPDELFRFSLPNTALDMDLDSTGLEIVTVHHDRHVRITSIAGKA